MFQWKQYELGVCYYPEQWDESLWREDLRRMKEAGIGTVRVAEFCWVIFEPAEGEFHFELFDRFLNLCEEEGIKVILGTPTATPPAWLTEKYPEVLNCRIDGIPYCTVPSICHDDGPYELAEVAPDGRVRVLGFDGAPSREW